MKADVRAIAETIISLEHASNVRWNGGDYRGFLDNYSEDVTYFDPLTDKLLIGRNDVEDHLRRSSRYRYCA